MTNKSQTTKKTEVLTLVQFIEQHVIADKTQAIQDLKLHEPAKINNHFPLYRTQIFSPSGEMLVQFDWDFYNRHLYDAGYEIMRDGDNNLWGIFNNNFNYWTLVPQFNTEYQALKTCLKLEKKDVADRNVNYFEEITEFYQVSEYLCSKLQEFGFAAIPYADSYLWGRRKKDGNCDLLLSPTINEIYRQYRLEVVEASIK